MMHHENDDEHMAFDDDILESLGSFAVPNQEWLRDVIDIMKGLMGPLLHDDTRDTEEIFREYFEQCDDTVRVATVLAELVGNYLIQSSHQMGLPTVCGFYHLLLRFYEQRLTSGLN